MTQQVFGKSIRVFLVDGQPTGILTAEIINWTGKIIVAPRAQLSDLARRPEVRRTGVYCLVGPDPEIAGRDSVYFGEGDIVWTRLTAHDRDESKDFWTRCAVVSSTDQNLTKAHVRYLESRLVDLGLQAGRATIVNGTEPQPPDLPEPDSADMDFFLSQMLLVFPLLGFGFLQPKPVLSVMPVANTPDGSPLFQYSVAGAEATARQVGDELVVSKGSTARKEGRQGWTSYRGLRDRLIAERKLVDGADPSLFMFAEDVPFKSPSAAAAVVNAGNMNGRTAWKIAETGQTYGEWLEQKVAAAGGPTDADG